MNIFDNFVKYGKRDSIVEIDQRVKKRTSEAVITIRGQSEYPLRGDEIRNFSKLGFRGTNARQTVASGTGIGLYVCNLILDRHGGKMYVEERSGNGILFTIILPNATAG